MTKDGAPGREPQDIIFNPYKEVFALQPVTATPP